MVDGTISNTDLAANSVTGTTIADSSVNPAELNVAAFSNTFWKVDGNVGTTPATHFIGTTDGAALRISAGNGVGVGTDTPDDALDVEGASPRIRISNTSETEGGLTLVDQQDPTNQFARIALDVSGTTNQNLNIYVDSTNPIVTVKGNQRVGIGTNNPTDAILDIEGDTRVNDNDIFLRAATADAMAWVGTAAANLLPGKTWMARFFSALEAGRWATLTREAT